MAPVLVVRADADGTVGAGHVMRCLALACQWREQGGEVLFIGRVTAAPLRELIAAAGCRFHPLPAVHPDPSDMEAVTAKLKEGGRPGWVVMDGYHFDAACHDAVRACGWPLLVVDDFAHLPGYRPDILLNPNAYAQELRYTSAFGVIRLLGSRYAPLRQEFLLARERELPVAQRGRRILVTMGGADPDNVGGRVVDALLAMGRRDLDVKIVIGPLNPHRRALAGRLAEGPFSAELLVSVTDMAELMCWADLAVSAAGSTCWELATLGVPMVVTVLADNQELVAPSLAAHGAAVNLGWYHRWQPEQAAGIIGGLLEDRQKRERMGENGRRLVDGMGCERIVGHMLKGLRDRFSDAQYHQDQSR